MWASKAQHWSWNLFEGPTAKCGLRSDIQNMFNGMSAKGLFGIEVATVVVILKKLFYKKYF